MASSVESPAQSAAWAHPVLASAAVVHPLCRDVLLDRAKLAAVADWMRFEEFASLESVASDPARPSLASPQQQIDFTLVTVAINFAYTDFETQIPWSVSVEGVELIDADAMFARFEQAHAAGIPVLDGAWLAQVGTEQLGAVLHGPREIPLLAERAAVLRTIGAVLVEHYEGRFWRFVESCDPRAFADGNGLVERLVAEFSPFDDSSVLHGEPVTILKLAQLGVWTLHRLGLVHLEDVDSLAVFADYIVPAALRAMNVLSYSPPLAEAVDTGQIIPAGSDWENEIRMQTIYACGVLTEALNARRPGPDLINPQIDYRFWSAFHNLIRPHHLTITTAY
ncbi:queuosine salvage family protein [Microbacterium sp. NPDC076911]|uniref:queuosine salvage family protein n=1 Tax=Microbacterium sp. NPDC076911 TaxID=3154958 RepID=UPI00342D79FE